MSLVVNSPLDLGKLEIQNAVIQQLASAPSSPVQGQIYYNTTDDNVYIWDGSGWVDLTVQGATYTAGDGLTLTGNDFDVNVGTGIEISSDALRIAAAAAGAGLTGGAGSALAVGAGTGITVNADDVAVNTSVIAPLASPTFTGDPKAPTPSAGDNDTSIATTAFVTGAIDTAVQGLKPKQSVRVATTGNITISTALNSGDSIDGVTLANGDRVLVKDQSSAAQNGIYVVAASPARSADANAWDELVGAYLAVEEGSTNADTTWLCTSNRGGTIDTTAVTWAAQPNLNSLTAGDGLDKTGNTIDVDSTVARRNADNTITGDVIASKATTGSNPVVKGDTSSSGIGVHGKSSSGAGVRAESTSSVGLSASSGSGYAVYGYSASGSGPAVVAAHNGSGAAFAAEDVGGTGPVLDGANIGPIVNIGDGVNADDAATVGQAGKTYKANIGDGSTTSIVVTHNLGTRDVMVEVFRNSGNYDTILVETQRTSTNAVTLVFAAAPTSNQFRVAIRTV